MQAHLRRADRLGHDQREELEVVELAVPDPPLRLAHPATTKMSAVD